MTKKQLIAFEARLVREWKKGNIRVPLHLSGGNEDALIALFEGIVKEDWVVSTHRNHYHYLLKGGNANELFNEIMGKSNALCGGRSGSMHTTDMRIRFISSCLVGVGAVVAVGIAEGIVQSGGSEKVWCFLGDGAVDEGSFWEALCYSESRNLPITFVIEDNDRSVCSSKEDRRACASLARWDALESSKVHYMKVNPTYPHVADGSYVSF